jgi:hypothetical protein
MRDELQGQPVGEDPVRFPQHRVEHGVVRRKKMQRDPDITIGWRVADNIPKPTGIKKGNPCHELPPSYLRLQTALAGIIDQRTGIDVPTGWGKHGLSRTLLEKLVR